MTFQRRFPYSYRGRYLMAGAATEIALGVSYALDGSSRRERLFEWLPFGFYAVGMFLAVVACIILFASTQAYRSRRWDAIGWGLLPIAPTSLALLWAWVGVMSLVDCSVSKLDLGLVPWANAVFFGCASWFTFVAASWPDPVPHPKVDPDTKVL